MALFDPSDEALIRSLLDGGLAFSEVANKWGVTIKQLARYCERKKIRYRTKQEQLSLVESEVIRLHAHCAVDEIARIVKRSERTVRRIIKDKCRQPYIERCKERVAMVDMLMKSKSLPAVKACKDLGITYGSYDYAKRTIKKHG